MLASHDEDTIADDELLTGTGSGGLFASGYLHDRPLIEYLDGDERVAYLLSNKKKGVRRESEAETTAVTPGDGYRAIAAVTDTRVLFVVGDGGPDGDRVFSVPYTEIEDVKRQRNVLTKHLDVWTTAGVRWRFHVRSTVDVDPAADYLDRAAVVWSRVESQLRHAETELDAATDATAAGDHDTAVEALATAQDHIDEAHRTATDLTTDRGDAIWDRIGTVDDRLEGARYELCWARGEAHRRTAESCWRTEQYNEAYDTYLAARTQYERALDAAHDVDAADPAEVRERVDAVTTQLDRLSKAPLRRAEEAHERARRVDDEAAVALYEEALERYQTALVLDWGSDDRRFAGDSDELRTTITRVVAELTETRRALAEQARGRGVDHLDAGRHERARRAFETARDHLQAARRVAAELKPDLVPALDDELDVVADALDRADRGVTESGFRFVGDTDTDD